jgi:hypothetical protein
MFKENTNPVFILFILVFSFSLLITFLIYSSYTPEPLQASKIILFPFPENVT